MGAPDLALAVLAAHSLDDAKALARSSLSGRQRLAPLKVAAHELSISTRTARRRAQAGAGVLTTKGWVVDLDAAEAMGRAKR